MTSYTAANRLLKELNAHQRKIRLGCSHDSQLVILQPQSDQDLFHWNATIYGRSNTPYAGGQFELEILVPKDYPTDPPRIRFITTICHPNIHIKSISNGFA
ncbi:hypothetical protein BDEG_25443 [Batrachochytrium dendrobatidis JEL423]|uniref:UBC core domain-containing protein n=1 Tax=Batrachochytrium dendrobatidis (strain JEL423) TaxID=403673 RepID=A0A177WQG4_BATDL|nr:hypothetical protein BDEG_25443 [Batrachochytrium dendrobatidis JEL423]